MANQTNSFPGGGAIGLPIDIDVDTFGTLPVARLIGTPVGAIAESGAALPAAGTIGKLFLLTTDGLVYRDDGVSFASVGGGSPVEPLFSCPAGVAIRDVVYISAADTVDKADASDISTAPAVGVVISKPTATTCRVKSFGVIPGFSGLTPKATIFLSTTAGGITESPPTGDDEVIQILGIVKDTDEILLNADNTLTLIELS